MARYRKKPPEVEAVVYDDSFDWQSKSNPDWLKDAIRDMTIYVSPDDDCVYINTVDGKQMVHTGDYIVYGGAGILRPFDPADFTRDYESVQEG